MSEAIQIIPKINRWAKKGGKIRKMGNGSNNSGNNTKKSAASLLVDQARAMGFINGKRIARKRR